SLFPYLSWNAPSWFVSVEFLLCLLFPLYAVVARRGGMRRGLLLLAAGFAGMAALVQFSGKGFDITFDYGWLRGLAGFASGAGLAVIFRNMKKRQPDYVLNVVQLGVVVMLAYALLFGGPPRTP